MRWGRNTRDKESKKKKKVELKDIGEEDGKKLRRMEKHTAKKVEGGKGKCGLKLMRKDLIYAVLLYQYISGAEGETG